MKKLTSAVVASSLVLGLVGTALAAPTADEQQASFNRMAAYDLARGTDKGPELDGTLTRAQLVTIIARAFGHETTANLLMDVGSFDDVPGGKWYSGYVAVAKNLATQQGFALGYPDGTFQPDKPVTVIEALAMIMKFLGVPVGTGDNWVNQTIENAKAAGVITDADLEKYFAEPNATATRGVAFALADQIFSTYKFPGTDKTVYTRFVDTVAPTLTVNKPANPTTTEATYTVTGIVEAGAEVFVNGEKATVANGSFSFAVELQPGENTITVNAVDLAGNVTTDVITITRVAGEAAKIVAEPLEVPAGSETELSFKVVDANDVELPDAAAEVQVTLSEGIGTYEDGIFKAAEKAGKGTITLTYGDLTETIEVTIVPGPLAGIKLEGGVESVAPGEAIRLIAVDEFGNEIEDATFSADHANVFIKDNKIFTATKAGEYTVTATVGDKSVEGKVLVYGEVDDLQIVVDGTIVANGESKHKVEVRAVDKNGALVRDFDEEIRLEGDLPITASLVKAVDGVATFEVKAPTVDGDYELIATYDDITAKLEVEVVEQEATSIKLESNTKYIGLGWRAVPFTGYVRVLDQAGKPMLGDDTWEVTLRVSGPVYFEGTKDRTLRLDVGGARKSFSLEPADYDTEGAVTVTAKADDLAEATLELQTVYAGAPRNLVISSYDTGTVDEGSIYRIGLTDRNGVPVIAAKDHEVKLTFNTSKVDVYYGPAADKATTKWSDLDKTGKTGVVKFQTDDSYVYVKVVPTDPVKSLPTTMRATSEGLTSASIDLDFESAEPEKVLFGDNEEVINVRPDVDTVIKVQIADEKDRPVKGSYKVRLYTNNSRVTINGKKEVTLYTDSEGKAEVTVKLPWYVDEVDIFADADFDKDGYMYTQVGKVTIRQAKSLVRSITGSAGLVETTSAGDVTGFNKTSTFNINEVGKLAFALRFRDSAGRSEDVELDDLTATIAKSGEQAVPVDLDEIGDYRGDVIVGVKNYTFTVGSYVLTITDEQSLYKPSVEIEFTITAGKATVIKVDSTPLNSTGWDDPQEVEVELLTGTDGLQADPQDFWVTIEPESGKVAQVKIGDGSWQDSITKQLIQNANSFKFSVRANESVNVTVTVFFNEAGTSYAQATVSVTVNPN